MYAAYFCLSRVDKLWNRAPKIVSHSRHRKTGDNILPFNHYTDLYYQIERTVSWIIIVYKSSIKLSLLRFAYILNIIIEKEDKNAEVSSLYD